MSNLAMIAGQSIDVTGPDWADATHQQRTFACHSATLFWTAQAKAGVPPTWAEYQLLPFATDFVKRLLPFGQQVRRPKGPRLGLFPGSVILFVKNGAVGHSCVATTPYLLGGYNQVGWYDQTGRNPTGVAHEYTVHSTDALKWITAKPPDRVDGPFPKDGPCQLLAVPEALAISVL